MHYAWMLVEEARQATEAARAHARALRESELLPPQRQRRQAVLGGEHPTKHGG